MKALYFFCTLLIFSAVCFSSCNEKPKVNYLVLVSDLTEDHFKGIAMSEFKKVSALSKNSMNGELARLVPITDFGFNRTYEVAIQKDSSLLMGNDYERTDLVNGYFSKIDTCIRLIIGEKHARSGSVIFKVLTEELNKLSESSADSKTALFNTDFMEKSFINFYDTAKMNAIKKHPDEMRKRLLEKYPIKQLKGIDIYFIYLPKDTVDSDRYEVLSLFYKNMFESFGAIVHIVGTI
ncbi:MAG: hypothetical protein IPO78_10185 [Saprospiraceae bacterium]|nr:hypothetical protein [Saprospiraceae bacterium]